MLRHLRSTHGVTNNHGLLNPLQDCGLVSDLCVSVDDIADGDLVRAYNRSFQE